jgi:protein gp37
MGDKSAIEWTDATWNPVTGCSHVSPGCDHCYAETLSLRRGWSKLPWTPENAEVNVVLHPERLRLPGTWRKPRMVFVNSMSDLFHPRVPSRFINDVWMAMFNNPQHTYQILTKRPKRLRDWTRFAAKAKGWPVDEIWPDWMWVGTSIESCDYVDRADMLRDVPAAVRFISAEPLLGPLAPDRMFCSTCSMEGPDDCCEECEGVGDWWLDGGLRLDDIHWLIVGGESGAGHRPIKEQWVTDLRDLAAAYDTAFFFKQWGGWTPKSGGRELEGRTWDEMPRPISLDRTLV